jgi:mono/diheme cytochrome c family protein
MKAAPLALASLVALLPAGTATAGDKNRLRAIGQGRALFLVHCASCHGADARGAAVGTDGGAPDLTRIEARDGAFEPVHVAKHVDGRRIDGVRPHRMPLWGDLFARSWPRGEAWAAAQVWKLTRYLDFVQETSPADAVAAPPHGR